MKYHEGMAVAALTLLAVIFHGFYNQYSFPHCVAVGVCIGAAVDFVIIKLLNRKHRETNGAEN